ncbi:MAG: T9SS type A sorting domain-containing protein, partial [Chitinophagales bacterium]
STISKIIFSVVFLFSFTLKANMIYGQIITYTNDTSGALNMVATHATAGALTRVNGAARLSSPCTNGYSTRSFTPAITYIDTLPAVQVIVSPNTSYSLHVDSFNVDIRHSATGPANLRYAYSINGGTTWIDQGTNQNPYLSATCDSMSTGTWITSFSVNSPAQLMFRVYGFNASGTLGNLQILNLKINGTVTSTTSVSEVMPDGNSLQVYPNPVTENATVSYHLSKEEKVSMSIYNLAGQEITPVINCLVQKQGDYDYTVAVKIPGIYFVKLTIGGTSVTRKIIKL